MVDQDIHARAAAVGRKRKSSGMTAVMDLVWGYGLDLEGDGKAEVSLMVTKVTNLVKGQSMQVTVMVRSGDTHQAERLMGSLRVFQSSSSLNPRVRILRPRGAETNALASRETSPKQKFRVGVLGLGQIWDLNCNQ
ncbi:hypothetical protein ACLB2K_007479 [Fragaria x ananassa]